MNGTDTFTEPGVISEEPNSFLSQDDTANELSKSQHDQCPSRRDFKRDSTLDCSNRQGWEPNLLTFDGGGVRGYWSLLVLQRLMEHIGREEESYRRRKRPNVFSKEPAYHSFDPQPYPVACSQLPRTDSEKWHQQTATAQGDSTGICNLKASKRYLPCHYFDYVGGSSTGALIAIMLGRLRMTVADCLSEYEHLGGEVFGNPRVIHEMRLPLISQRTKYDAQKLERVFEDVVTRRQESMTEKARFETKKYMCQTFVTTLATRYRKDAAIRPYIVRSYEYQERQSRVPQFGPRRQDTYRDLESQMEDRAERPQPRRDINVGRASNLSIPHVARAATAAVSFFDPLEVQEAREWIRFEDGGFGTTNNPTMVGVEEIRGLYGPNKKLGAVVSIGTARSDKATEEEHKVAESIKAKAKRFINLATSPDVEHRNMQTYAWDQGNPYYRFNPTSANHLLDIPLDQWLPRKSKKKRKLFGRVKEVKSGEHTLTEIRTRFEAYAGTIENGDAMRACAEELVQRRRRRVLDSARWERYATGSEFQCLLEHDGHKCDTDFSFRDQIRKHLERRHHVQGSSLDEMSKPRRTFTYQEREG